MKYELRYLTDDEMPLWDDLVDRSPQGCVFCQSWWIRASCGSDFKILGCFKGGRLVAGIPLHWVRYGPLRVCRMPKLSQSWGPVLEPMEGRYVSRLSREIELLRLLADRLKKIPFFFQCFHYNLQNWLPFYWAGFRQTTVFTYILDDISDEGALWSRMRHSLRKDIAKARRQSISVREARASEFLTLCGSTFARQGMRRPFSGELLRSVAGAARRRQAGGCFAAQDGRGRLHAAVFAAWDRRYLHAIMSGADPVLRRSGAYSLLLWWLVGLARDRGLGVDFCGSNLETAEPLLRAFGGRQQPFSRIIRAPLAGRIALTIFGKL